MFHWLSSLGSSEPHFQTTILNLEWEITVRRSMRRRTTEIRVGMDGVRVLCPANLTDDSIRLFVESRRNWINATLQIVALHRCNIKPNHNGSGLHIYRGRSIKPAEILGKSSLVGMETDSVTVKTFSDPRDPKRFKWHDWLRRQAEKRLLKRTQYFSSRMKLVPQLIEVKEYKSMWGRCNSRGEVAFDWRIIQAPDDVLDYLVVHELAHLKHFNHSREFWALVFLILPDYKSSKKWLLQNGHRLRFG